MSNPTDVFYWSKIHISTRLLSVAETQYKSPPCRRMGNSVRHFVKIKRIPSFVKTMLHTWQIPPVSEIPLWFETIIKEYTAQVSGKGSYLAQLLWHRGMREEDKIRFFLDSKIYQPTSAFDFGQEMKRAVKRLNLARERGEKVCIWGDFDADGITSTAVLWEGLGQFFAQETQLTYYIPNRLTESHGLNCTGIDSLARKGISLIVTCDTGSTNLKEIDYAQQLGIDIIVTDHHTLPDHRPAVVAIINPRYFAQSHPLYCLSGVAVAYKLVEALYLAFPDIPQQPLRDLLDLVAVGLIADLVELKGDCRYLAQRGIEQLQKTNRPGLDKLLKLCKGTGDRPMDISFGIAPRINAVSRIYGDARFCVQLLTTKDEQEAYTLANQAEEANINRKELQQKVLKQAQKKVASLDLSTTAVIVLEDSQWQTGVLGLVASGISQEYGRPSILLSTMNDGLARGSARSINGINLYDLVVSQKHLLHNFGGHPFAAGLALPLENLSLFRDGINQRLKQQLDVNKLQPVIEIDLVVTVEELTKNLFRELKLIEPCGMGNPAPKLLVKNCWFTNVWHESLTNRKNRKIKYLVTHFMLCDRTCKQGIKGDWWGHNKDEIIMDRNYDVVIEFDFNKRNDSYEPRIIDLKLSDHNKHISSDYHQYLQKNNIVFKSKIVAKTAEFNPHIYQDIWIELLGIIKFLINHQKTITKEQLRKKINIGEKTLSIALSSLQKLGFDHQYHGEYLTFYRNEQEYNHQEYIMEMQKFVEITREEYVRSLFTLKL